MARRRIIQRMTKRLERLVDRGGDTVRRGIYGRREAHIAAYRSYGTRERVHVRGRVLHGALPSPATPRDRWWVNLGNAFRRLETDQVEGARVRVHFEGDTAEGVTGRQGHFRIELRPREAPTASYWHDARIDLVDPPGASVTVPVAIPVEPVFGVISDLDDTVLQTGVRNVLRMGREVLLGNAHTRIPFPGIGAFYRALHTGGNPLFYVSSSPWNLYDVLGQFLHLHDIPAGPMDLRDWGIADLPFRHSGHKRRAIDRILATYPGIPFILVGDSGQQDPEIYGDVVHDHPHRVLAIYIRNVRPHPERVRAIRELSAELAGLDIDLVLADDTLDAARHAADRGWIDPDAVQQVARGRERERARED